MTMVPAEITLDWVLLNPGTAVEYMKTFRQRERELLTANTEYLERARKAETALKAANEDVGAFKNFHRSLCDRFNYTHDEKDWRRDQVSLEEWIANRVKAAERERAAPDWLLDLMQRYPLGTQLVSPIDDLDGEVVGYYRTREAKLGLDLQQNGKRIVHVYQTKWFDGSVAIRRGGE